MLFPENPVEREARLSASPQQPQEGSTGPSSSSASGTAESESHWIEGLIDQIQAAHPGATREEIRKDLEYF